MINATCTIRRRVNNASSLTWCGVKCRTTWSVRMMNAGPAANALARNRGAMMAEFQNGRPPRPT